MGVIADKRLKLIRGLVRALPQGSLRSLEMALGLTRDEALIEVRDLISAELEFRHVREAVFAPYLPLFAARADGLDSVVFPVWLLDNLWKALEAREPELYVQSRYALRGLRTEDPTPVVFFRLVSAAAQTCRDNPHDVLPADPAPTDGEVVAEFARYLDLHRNARTMLARLPDLLGRIDADRAAGLRLMFKDACVADSAGGSRLLEILYGNLHDGAQIIKFVATVADNAGERFLAMSELAVFGDRILKRIDERLDDLRVYMGGRNRVVDDMELAGQKVAQALGLMHAFENYIDLARDGPWGRQIAAGHKLIAELVEGQLKGAERVLDNALPLKSERIYGRVRKETPSLDRLPDPELVERARRTLGFVKGVRNVAHAGGFASLHTKTTQALEASMDSYFEELLAIANGDESFDSERVMVFFETVTDLMEALCGEDKAGVARRRVASSDVNNPRTAKDKATQQPAA